MTQSSSSASTALVACGAMVAVSAVILLAVCAYLFQQFVAKLDEYGAYRDPDNVAYAFAEQLVEVGSFAAEPDFTQVMLESRTIVLTEEINERSTRSVLRQLQMLEQADDQQAINLWLLTSGGWVDGAFAIVDHINRLSVPVNIHADGGCYSGCVVLLAAATGERSAGPNCILSVHANRSSSEAEYGWPNRDLKRYEDHFQALTRMPAEWFPLTADRSYYLTAAEALEFGIIDAIR